MRLICEFLLSIKSNHVLFSLSLSYEIWWVSRVFLKSWYNDVLSIMLAIMMQCNDTLQISIVFKFWISWWPYLGFWFNKVSCFNNVWNWGVLPCQWMILLNCMIFMFTCMNPLSFELSSYMKQDVNDKVLQVCYEHLWIIWQL